MNSTRNLNRRRFPYRERAISNCRTRDLQLKSFESDRSRYRTCAPEHNATAGFNLLLGVKPPDIGFDASAL